MGKNRSIVVAGVALVSWQVACGRTGAQLSPSRARDASPAGSSADATVAVDLGSIGDSPSSTLPPDVPPDGRIDSLADLSPPDTRSLTCGNGRLDTGEQCDDGNVLSGDGCDSRCQVECDWYPCGLVTPPVAVCGNGILSGAEACDDKNTSSGDGCSSACVVEAGFRCTRIGRPCTPICGDGLIVGTETCDDGNEVGGDGCSESCLTEPGWDCSAEVCRRSDAGVVGPSGYCGDGVIQGAEECDDGSANDDGNYLGCSLRCRVVQCGDGLVNGDEACDLGWQGNTTGYGDPGGCTPGCKRPAFCGDGVVQPVYGEECDNGPDLTFPCLPGCRLFLP